LRIQYSINDWSYILDQWISKFFSLAAEFQTLRLFGVFHQLDHRSTYKNSAVTCYCKSINLTHVKWHEINGRQSQHFIKVSATERLYGQSHKNIELSPLKPQKLFWSCIYEAVQVIQGASCIKAFLSLNCCFACQIRSMFQVKNFAVRTRLEGTGKDTENSTTPKQIVLKANLFSILYNLRKQRGL